MRRRWKPVSERYTDSLTRIAWDEFERRLAEYYRAQGYRVEHTGTGSTFAMADGGIDLKLFRDEEFAVVQCKHWNVAQVPHNAVHELIGVMHTEGATRAIVITSGEYTAAALRAASKFPAIELVDGAAVRQMLGTIPESGTSFPPLSQAPSWTTKRQRRAQSPRSGLYKAAATLVMTVVVPLIVYFFVTRVITDMGRSISHSTQQNAQDARARRAASSETQWLSQPARRDYVPMPAPVDPAAPITTPDGKPAALGTTPMSKNEIAEWQKQNEKAMKILEKTTPEL